MSTPTQVDILFFVEDPGSANYIIDLPELLRRRGVTTIILADGEAVEFLRDRRIEMECVQADTFSEVILDKYQPWVVAVGTCQNPASLGLLLIDMSRTRGITTVGMIDMEVDAELRFRGKSDDSLAHSPDWLLVPDESTKRTFEELGYPVRRIEICGNPNYDRVRRVAKILSKRDKEAIKKNVLPRAPLDGRPIVVFVSEHVDGCNYEVMHRSPEYTLHGRGGNDGRTAIVLEEILDTLSEINPRPYFVVRLHPKNSKEEFSNYLKENDFLSVGGDPLELVWIADLVVGMTSMLMMEAVILGKTTLSVLPRIEEKAWSPDTTNELTPCVTTREELRRVLGTLLKKKSYITTKTAASIIYGASERVARFISEMVTNVRHLHQLPETDDTDRALLKAKVKKQRR